MKLSYITYVIMFNVTGNMIYCTIVIFDMNVSLLNKHKLLLSVFNIRPEFIQFLYYTYIYYEVVDLRTCHTRYCSIKLDFVG